MSSTTATTAITISPTAYSLVILHAAKHPSRTIVGLLLGTATSKSVTVQHVVPLQHHWTALSTIPQVGTSLAQAHFGSQQPPLQIVGAYEANAALDARQLSPSTVRLCGRIAERAGGSGVPALGLLVQNALLLTPTNPALLPFHIPAAAAAAVLGGSSSKAVVSKPSTTAGSADPVDLSSEVVALKGGAVSIEIEGGLEKAVKETKTAIGKGTWKLVVDLDDHLENTGLDWLGNSEAVKELSV